MLIPCSRTFLAGEYNLSEEACYKANNSSFWFFPRFSEDLSIETKIPSTLASIEEQYLIFITIGNGWNGGVFGDVLSDVFRVIHVLLF